MELNDTFIKNKQAELYLKYKQQLDETSIVILIILSEEMEQSFEEQNWKLGDAVEKINNTQRFLQVNRDKPNQQAFWFGMGKSGFSLTVLILSLFIFCGIYMYNKNEQKYNTGQLKWYQQFYNDTKNHYSQKQWSEYLKQNPFPQQ